MKPDFILKQLVHDDKKKPHFLHLFKNINLL